MARVELETGDAERVIELIRDTFDDVVELRQFVQLKDPQLYARVTFANLGGAAHEVVLKGNGQGTLDRFVVACADSRTDRPEWRGLQFALSRRKGWGVAAWAHPSHAQKSLAALEQHLGPGDPFISLRLLGQWLPKIERHVCHVTCGGAEGTGFLIGPDLVLTCHHVVRRHISDHADVAVRFDYVEQEGEVASGDWLPLDPDWAVVYSPASHADIPPFAAPLANELDYAVLKLSSSPGGQVVAGTTRGWVDMTGELPMPEQDTPVLIVGHPCGIESATTLLPMQVSFHPRGFRQLNENQTRLVYCVDTRAGSSGSPVFDAKLRPFGLHHAAGRPVSLGSPSGEAWSSDNRGIPLVTIRADLPSHVMERLTSPPEYGATAPTP